MPASLNGRRLTAVMRDGKRLCPAFQSGQCPGERVCGFAHLCACVRLTGRACGGKHAAGVCRVTKVVMVEDPEASIPARPSGAASSGSASAEAMMLSPKIKAVPQKRPPEPSGRPRVTRKPRHSLRVRRLRSLWPRGTSCLMPLRRNALRRWRRAFTRMRRVAVCGCPDSRSKWRRPISRP